MHFERLVHKYSDPSAHRGRGSKKFWLQQSVYVESCMDICATPRDTKKEKKNAQTVKMLLVGGYGVRSIVRVEWGMASNKKYN